jgi:hypothetical protein
MLFQENISWFMYRETWNLPKIQLEVKLIKSSLIVEKKLAMCKQMILPG